MKQEDSVKEKLPELFDVTVNIKWDEVATAKQPNKLSKEPEMQRKSHNKETVFGDSFPNLNR